MGVYVDSEFIRFGRMKMCHMVADTEEELEHMAIQLGLNLMWWQYKGTPKSHFDVSKSVREKAISLGVSVIDRKEIVEIIRNKRLKFLEENGSEL
jgi:hypothetical protein